MSDAVNLRIDPRNGEKNWTGLISETLTVGEFEELPGVFGVLLTQVPHPTSIEVYKATDPSVPLTRITTTGEPGASQFWSDSQQLKPRGYVIVNDSLDGDDIIIIYRGGGYLAHKRVLEDVIPVGPPGPAGGVNTVFGRAGTVVAVSGDYTQDLVTDGSTYKQFSATEKTKLAAVETAATASNKASIADNDRFLGGNSASSDSPVYWLWSLIKSTLKTYFDTLYLPSRFTSSAQTITSGGSLTIAHGLGAVPFIVSYYLQCTTAEYNYAIGDKLFAGMVDVGINGANGTGVSVSTNGTTNIDIRFGSVSPVFLALNKTSGAAVQLTNANWALYVYAQK